MVELEVTSSIVTTKPNSWLNSSFAGEGWLKKWRHKENNFYKKLFKDFLKQRMPSLS